MVFRNRWAPRLAAVVLVCFALGADSSTKPATGPGLEVKVCSVGVNFVKLRHRTETGQQDGTFVADDDPQSDEKLVVVRIEIVNTGTESLAYHTFSGADRECPGFAYLKDDNRQTYSVVQFGEMEPVGSLRYARIAPGESAKDVLVFQRPPKGAGPVHLILPAKNVGGAGPVEVVLAWEQS